MNILLAIVRKYRHILLSSALALIIVVIVASMVYAAYHIGRPITTTGGVVNQSYLWGESSGGSTHKGVDFSYGLGTSVYAVADGVVKDVVEFYEDGSTADGGSGNLVLIKHNTRHYVRQNNGQTVSQMGYVYSIYGHLRKNSVIPSEGDAVTAGQRIAEVDDTDNSSGNHVHLQVVLDQSPDHNNGADYSWTEIASRNPELWLQPFSYGTQTTTAIGKLTDTAGNPVGGKLIVGIEKPAAAGGDPTGCGANGYGSSLTYNYTWTNPDDILGENFGTTDVAPGTYHLYAYDTFSYQACQGTLYRDLGNYIFSSYFPTYIGLYPFYFPDTAAVSWSSTVNVHNSSTTYASQARSSFFYDDGSVQSQQQTNIGTTSRWSISPSLSSGSAYPLKKPGEALARRPGGPQVELGRLLADEISKSRDGVGAGDAVTEIVNEVEAEFLGGSGQGLESVPGGRAVAGTGTKADIALADA
ncbi:MAG: M23 family metallopeptidase [Ardenticatenaceae bacterium]|nr:M23 family metallopeptidase [Ardenticatenaceae bacterium]